MALDPATLGAALYTAMSAFDNQDPATIGNIEVARQNFCNALATAIVTHITANASVLALGLVAPPSGGPVTGSARIV